MLNRLLALLFVFVLVPSCALWSKIAPVVTQVISAVADAIPIVETIAQWCDRHFSAAPDPVAQAKVDAALNRCRHELTLATRAIQGDAEGVTREAALEGFRTAWGDLGATLRALPGVSPLLTAGASKGSLGLADQKTGETLSVPEPLAAEVE